MKPDPVPSARLAAKITRASSTQSYFTILFLVDRPLVADAFRAYAYFRWVDDVLDAGTCPSAEHIAFVQRQQRLLDACYRGETVDTISAEERMLVDLVRSDRQPGSLLQSYLRHMMAVMAFDVERRGRLISQIELTTYSRVLSKAVTDALHYFIGQSSTKNSDDTRYLPVQGAHIIHMLRDWAEDREAGYFNLPRQYVEAGVLSLQEVDTPEYRNWVKGRVSLAQVYFQAGREYLAHVRSLRLRLACAAYIARFEWMAHAIEQDGFCLRRAYSERKSLTAGIWMLRRTLETVFGLRQPASIPSEQAV